MTNEVIESVETNNFELRKLEIKAGVRKVVYGTTIVGVAATFFPFAQQSATELANYLTHTTVEARTVNESRRVFLESLAEEGRSPNLAVRIILAEYYAYLAEEPERTQWKALLERLELQQRELWAAEQARDVTAANAESTPEDIVRTSTAARQMRDSADPEPHTGTADPASFHGNVDLLSSDDSGARRRARETIAKLGFSIVRPSLDILAEPDLEYRPRLGLVVVLTLFMRDHKPQRDAIIDLLGPDDLVILLNAAADPDRTVRLYASEFLYDLGDPRVFDLIPPIWSVTTSPDRMHGLAVAMTGSAPFARSDQIAAARALMRERRGELGADTNSLLSEGLELLPQ